MYYKEMEVWKEAVNLVTDIYKITEDFPEKEMFGLTSQIRRCVISVPSNISEGAVKHYDKDIIRFIDIALGSLAELDTQMLISQNLGYISNYDKIEEKIKKVRALAIGLMKYLETKVDKNS